MFKNDNFKRPRIADINEERRLHVNPTKLSVLLAKTTHKNLNEIKRNELESPVSLIGHSLRVMNGVNQILINIEISYQNSSEFLELLQHVSSLAGLFHDFGKACIGFQQMLINDEIRRWPPETGGNRHEVISMIIALQNINLENLEQVLPQEFPTLNITPDAFLKLVLFAIITHHKSFAIKNLLSDNTPKIKKEQWPFNGKRFKLMYKELLYNKQLLQESWSEAVIQLQQEPALKPYFQYKVISETLIIKPHHELQALLDLLEKQQSQSIFENNEINERALLNPKVSYLPTGYYYGDCLPDEVKQIPSSIRLLLSTSRGLTIASDHLMSGGKKIPKIPVIQKYEILGKFSPRAFQKILSQTKGHAMLRAPTGSGKTEAALLWVKNNQKTRSQKATSRVFYVLPYTSSINAMFLRLSKIFHEESLVGVLHSKAAVALYSMIETEQYEGAFPSKTKDKKAQKIAQDLSRLAHEVYYPIKVTTPHQLIRVFLMGKGWETQLLEIFNGLFIFDEIHAYDPSLTGLIIGMARTLTQPPLNGKLLFMSATFPSFLQELILKYVNNDIPLFTLDENEASDREILDQKKHHVSLQEEPVTKYIQKKEIKELILQKNNTVIIVNTVKTAQKIYSELKEELSGIADIQLFHSRFKARDRSNIENQVIRETMTKRKKPYILVSTQVIEVSLDIDFEFGIIEVSPLDSLIQRLGRINRRGKHPISQPNCMITKYEPNSRFVYRKRLDESFQILAEWLKNHSAILTENDKITLVETLYHTCPWDKKEIEEFMNTIQNKKLQNFFEEIIPGTYTRWVDEVIDKAYASIDVYLEEDKDVLIQYLKSREYVKMLTYTTPIYKIKNLNEKLDWSLYPKLPFPILKKEYYTYSCKTGLTLL